MKRINICVMLLFLFACSSQSGNRKQSAEATLTAPTVPLFVQMSDAELKRNPDPRLIDFREKPKWEYTNGLICLAVLQVWQKTGDEKYYNYAKSYADSMIRDNGSILTYKKSDFNIDRLNAGKFLFTLYNQESTDRYRLALDTLRSQMEEHPRTAEGGFWHKKRYPNQMWLDGLYMGSPMLAQYAAEFEEPALFDDVAQQFYLIDKYTWDNEKELFYHGWDESKTQRWSNPETGVSPHFWGRGMGWLAMALVDVLDYFPEDHPKREVILNILDKMAKSVVRYQDEETGVWWQVLDKAHEDGNYLEASCSSMFTYFLLKGVQKGYLSDEYKPVAEKAYKGVVSQFVKYEEDGTVSLTNICGVAGLGGTPYRSGTYEYYINEPKRDNDPKGVGPFIMASLLYETQFADQKNAAL
ncbi:glycoside hydrolase family 88 protein [Limibacter armeniacum]|uniref:glycoside hydrolase family 88/105 protein n=1 Tax=Limibacter armeniacum TaxID=466084 RepID=UPI002FE6C05D